jgi:hypothetical protein
MLSTYPQQVLDRAVNPAAGIPAMVTYLNLASIRKHLDGWADEFDADRRRREIANRKRLPEPERDPQVEARVNEGFRKLSLHLKRGFSPSTAE